MRFHSTGHRSLGKGNCCPPRLCSKRRLRPRTRRRNNCPLQRTGKLRHGGCDTARGKNHALAQQGASLYRKHTRCRCSLDTSDSCRHVETCSTCCLEPRTRFHSTGHLSPGKGSCCRSRLCSKHRLRPRTRRRNNDPLQRTGRLRHDGCVIAHRIPPAPIHVWRPATLTAWSRASVSTALATLPLARKEVAIHVCAAHVASGHAHVATTAVPCSALEGVAVAVVALHVGSAMPLHSKERTLLECTLGVLADWIPATPLYVRRPAALTA